MDKKEVDSILSDENFCINLMNYKKRYNTLRILPESKRTYNLCIYAVEKFFSKFEKIRRGCTYESWQLRITKRRKRKNRRFWYIVPAVLMELPGNWILVCGDIDPVGVNIRKIEFLKGKEIAFSKGNIRCKKARIGDKI